MHPFLITLAIINSSIFLVLSAIHFFWALGGSWGFDKALPTNLEEIRVLNPKKIASAVVAIGLLLFAIYTLIYGHLISFSLPNWLNNYGILVISAVFLLRAIGDFKYVGVFKKIKSTAFGQRDTRYYSPLCLLLSINGIVMFFVKFNYDSTLQLP